MRDQINELNEQMLARIQDRMGDEIDSDELAQLAQALRDVSETHQHGEELLEEVGRQTGYDVGELIELQQRANGSRAEMIANGILTPEGKYVVPFVADNGAELRYRALSDQPRLETPPEFAGPVEWASPEAAAAAERAGTSVPSEVVLDDEPQPVAPVAIHASSDTTRYAVVRFDEAGQVAGVDGPYAGIVQAAFHNLAECDAYFAQPDQAWKKALQENVARLTGTFRSYAQLDEIGAAARVALEQHDAWVESIRAR